MPLLHRPARLAVTGDAAVRVVTAAYRALLGREPDPAGLASYAAALQEGRSAAWLLDALAGSDEFRDRVDPLPARLARAGLTDLAGNALSRELAQCTALARGRYDALWQRTFGSGRPLIVGQDSYAVTHRERFFELFNAAVVLTRGRPAPRILEFGPSEFSAIYADVVPGAALTIVDRPVPAGYVGFTEERCRATLNCAHYAALDLASIADMDAKLDALGRFDLVVMTEVIEHLPIHPLDVLRRVLRLLAPEGVLYLTTPNFFAQANVDRLARGENPCAQFPEGDGNWDAHHHYREYEAVELAALLAAAGGSVVAFLFSGCWDAHAAAVPPHRRGNLVFVVRAGG